jgi:signal transduction histidine kinase
MTGEATPTLAEGNLLLTHLTRQLEESRLVSRALEGLLQAVADAVLVAEASGRILFASRGAEAIWPEKAPLEGKTLDALEPGWRPESRPRMLWRGERVYEVVQIPQGAETPGGVAVALRDVTAQRQREEELERLRPLARIGRWLSTVLHELRNPLAVVQGSASLLARSVAGGEEHLRRIQAACDAMQRLVEELLVLARPLHPRPRDVSLAAVLAEVARTAGEGIRVEVRGEGAAVRADPDFLRQILQNLVRNAEEAMEGRGELRLEIVPGPPGRVRILVADSGPGLAPEEIPKIFEPFHTTKPGGTGLGLPTSRRLAEAMGGRLDALARPGLGALFVLELPAAGGEATGS